MHRIICLTVAVLVFFCHPAMAQSSSDWEGTYTGTIFGSYSTMTTTLSGSQWNAAINVEAGYAIYLEGSVNGDECKGTLRDEVKQKFTSFTAWNYGNQIAFDIKELNPLTGYEEDMSFAFSKDVPFQSSPVTAQIGNDEPDLPPGAIPIDRSLFGLWNYTHSEVSGGFIVETHYFIQFFDNGVMLFTDGITAGVDDITSLNANDPATHHNKWKAENQIISTRDPENNWQSYARYHVENGTLLLIFGKGKQEVWAQW